MNYDDYVSMLGSMRPSREDVDAMNMAYRDALYAMQNNISAPTREVFSQFRPREALRNNREAYIEMANPDLYEQYLTMRGIQ